MSVEYVFAYGTWACTAVAVLEKEGGQRATLVMVPQARHMVPQARHMVPQAGHEVWTGDCVTGIAQTFLANPESDLDVTCLERRQERFSLMDDVLE